MDYKDMFLVANCLKFDKTLFTFFLLFIMSV